MYTPQLIYLGVLDVASPRDVELLPILHDASAELHVKLALLLLLRRPLLVIGRAQLERQWDHHDVDDQNEATTDQIVTVTPLHKESRHVGNEQLVAHDDGQGIR